MPRNVDLEEDAEDGVDRKENERVNSAGDRGNERRLAIVTESHKTQGDVFRARDEGGRAGERDDVGVRRGEERAVEEKVDGRDTCWNGDGPGGDARSGAEQERVEDADSDGR